MLAMRFGSLWADEVVWLLVSDLKIAQYGYLFARVGRTVGVRWFPDTLSCDRCVRDVEDTFRSEGMRFTGFAERMDLQLPPVRDYGLQDAWGQQLWEELEDRYFRCSSAGPPQHVW